MSKVGLKPRRYSCLTAEQQDYYNKLPQRQRQYIDFRMQGYSKTASYKMAGYESKNATQSSYIMENRNKGMVEIIEALSKAKKVKDLAKSESAINQTINALAEQKTAEQVLDKIDGMDGETAKRVKFFRDIANGTIKSVRKTKRYNAEGALVETKIEEVSDIDTRIKARKELDRILGLNSVIDLDKIQMGDITINIVDASKKEELEDSRNRIIINPDQIEEIDGEKVIVTENVEKAPTPEQVEVTVETVEKRARGRPKKSGGEK